MLLVREKERLGPIWINRTQRRFPDSPVFLSVSSNRPLKDILSAETARRERIGLANADSPSQLQLDVDPPASRFRSGMIRMLEEKGLYAENERGVTFLSGALFSAPIEVPATAPTGPYEIEIVLYSGGVPLARQIDQFRGGEDGHRAGPGERAPMTGPSSTAWRRPPWRCCWAGWRASCSGATERRDGADGARGL